MKADINENAPASTPPVAQAAPSQTDEGIGPKLWHVVVIALIAIAFTAVWLGVFEALNQVIWSSAFVAQNPWAMPALVLFFSLLVGLAQKYLRAPNVIHGGAIEAVVGEEPKTSERIPFPGTLLSSFASLLSGASIGPEGALSFLVIQIANWLEKRMRIAKAHAAGFEMAALASMFNGLIGSPLFTGVMATEMRVGGIGARATAFIVWNLLAGTIGFLFYALLGLPTFAQSIAFTPVSTLTVEYVVIAIILGFVGALTAVLLGVLMQVFHRIMDRLFKDNVITRVLAAGVIIAIVGYFAPAVMFTGETQIDPIIANPAQYGVATLILYGLLKLMLLALAFKSGYVGGPVFPILFACTMFGEALGLLFPTVPLSIFVLCIEAAAITLMLRAPLTAILLVVVLGTATQNEGALIVLSSVTAMILGMVLTRIRAQRAAKAKLEPGKAEA
jgi:H+/Cl- antiporter ClcA